MKEFMFAGLDVVLKIDIVTDAIVFYLCFSWSMNYVYDISCLIEIVSNQLARDSKCSRNYRCVDGNA